MADCLVREGLVDSAAVSALNDWPYRVYTLLLIQADFAGRFDGRLEFIRSRLFPLGVSRRTEDIRKALDEIEANGLILRYEFAGKPYLQLSKVTRRFHTETALFPFSDGSYRIEYMDMPAPGDKERTAWVKTSLFDPIPIPSQSHMASSGIPVSVSVSGNGSQETSTRAKVEFPPELNTPDFAEAWAEYIQHRAEIKKRLTPIAIRNAMLRMKPWGAERAVAALRHSMAGSYQGIWEPGDKGKANGKCSDQKHRLEALTRGSK